MSKSSAIKNPLAIERVFQRYFEPVLAASARLGRSLVGTPRRIRAIQIVPAEPALLETKFP